MCVCNKEMPPLPLYPQVKARGDCAIAASMDFSASSRDTWLHADIYAYIHTCAAFDRSSCSPTLKAEVPM